MRELRKHLGVRLSVASKSAAEKWSTPPLKARWYDCDDDVQAENALKTTSTAAALVENQALTVQAFFDLLATDEPPQG